MNQSNFTNSLVAQLSRQKEYLRQIGWCLEGIDTRRRDSNFWGETVVKRRSDWGKSPIHLMTLKEDSGFSNGARESQWLYNGPSFVLKSSYQSPSNFVSAILRSDNLASIYFKPQALQIFNHVFGQFSPYICPCRTQGQSEQPQYASPIRCLFSPAI